MSDKGGEKAKKQGDSQRDHIKAVLTDAAMNSKGIKISWRPPKKDWADPCCYESIYGTKRVPHIAITGVPGFNRELCIESHSQAVSGSGDEKPPFFIANVKKSGLPTIMVVEMEPELGSSPYVKRRFGRVMEYYNSQIDGEVLVSVMTPRQFEIWIRDAVHYHGF